ncbi:hypothetical protein I79_020959 [Cricetulus griseus]|uniref:Uncharacterized protein n=1 Tax=Cricetulus griseus TaxID=10029 RepID=G3IBD9_CRIGR|nr:hypothetical protein I79_020959 [Cricetulus griseus]
MEMLGEVITELELTLKDEAKDLFCCQHIPDNLSSRYVRPQKDLEKRPEAKP